MHSARGSGAASSAPLVHGAATSAASAVAAAVKAGGALGGPRPPSATSGGHDQRAKTILKEAVYAVVNSFAKHTQGYGRCRCTLYVWVAHSRHFALNKDHTFFYTELPPKFLCCKLKS